jgi:hypothetical protein
VRKSIVDIGCFAGDFLHWLPEGWEKWGIEPAAAAREVAHRGAYRLWEKRSDLA